MTIQTRFTRLLAAAFILVGAGSAMAATRTHTLTAPSTVKPGAAVQVIVAASTDAGDGEQIGFFHSEYSTDGGNVNLMNGNLNLEIPLATLPGRNGHNFVLSVQYDSKNWTPSATFPSGSDIIYIWKPEMRKPQVGDVGWRLNLPSITQGPMVYDQSGGFAGYGDFIVTMPDGGKHNIDSMGYIMDSEDGSTLRMHNSNPLSSSGDLWLQEKDGTSIQGTNVMTDTNGNSISYNLANNTLNWQWAAGCGADAAPYFRIFNPETQAKRFDPDNEYIRKWVPHEGYPGPVVDLKTSREAALDAYVTMRRARLKQVAR